LVHEPGKAFLYATINYDVLGLILQHLSGKSFEEYMREKVLDPLGLTQTVFPGNEGKRQNLATGYKLCFGKPSAYDAPVYRGNTPAGYFIMNAGDLARWLKIQLDTVKLPGFDKELITKSHVSDPNLTSSNYAAGWFVFSNSGQVMHGGNNPNFSSLMVFSPDKKIGIGVLANRNSNFMTGTAEGIGAILKGEEPRPSFEGYDMNMRIDAIATKVVLILLPFIFLAILLLIRSIFRIGKKKKQFSARGIKGGVAFIISSVSMIAWLVVIIKIPSFLGFDLPLGFGFVWMPKTFTYAVLVLFLLGALYYLFFLSAFFFRKKVN
jgi:putative ATP-binding cassette transporter